MNITEGRIAQAETRKLAAIMFTDIVGFSRQMGTDEARMLRLLDVHNQLIQQAVTTHHGHVIKTIGDAFLVEFPSVVHAVQCAQSIHAQFRAHNAEKDKTEQIHVRIGIHLGDIVQKDDDVFGDGVNIAARLQSFAEPDTICISQTVYKEVEKKLPLGTVVSLGKPTLKNIVERFAVYALLPAPPVGVRQKLQVQRLKLSRRLRPVHWLSVVGLLFVIGILVTVRYLPFLRFLLFPPQPFAPNTAATLPPLPLPDKPSIVVLPFDNMSKDPEQDYFSDGITEDLTSNLSRISSLFVIAHNSAFTYKGKAVKVQDVSKEMGARYVLEGSVRKADNQVRITAQLIDATTGEHLWAERYDRPLKDIFALQDEIVQKIATTLKLQLILQEQGWGVRKHTDNLEAYDAFLRGVELNTRNTKETNAQARQMLEKAIALDPQYAEAIAFLGYAYYREYASRWSADPQTLERALTLVQQAVVLDESLPVAHSFLSMIYAQKQQYDQALTEAVRAITLDPNNAESYRTQGYALILMGRPEDALRMMEQAMRLNPRYPPLYLFQLGLAYVFTGRYGEAVATLEQFLTRSPDHFPGHIGLANCYVQQWAAQQNADPHTLEQALAAVQRAVALNVSDPLGQANLGMVLLWQKQYEQALIQGEKAVALDSSIWAVPYTYMAETLSRVGKPAAALRMVEQALRRRPFSMDGHLYPIGTTYYFAGRPAEAIAPLKQYLTRYPNILGAHLILAAVYSELGKEAEARAEVAEVLRINPKFSLEVHKERAPIKDPVVLERHIAALRKAGLK